MNKRHLDLTKAPPLPDTLEESHQVILALWEVVAELQAWKDELEEQLNTGSDNSSSPPSQDSPKKRAERKRKAATGRQKGAQTGHKKYERALLPEDQVDTIKRYYPDTRCECGGLIHIDSYQRHQVFDVPEVRYEITEHQRYTGCCQRCGERRTAHFPQSVPTGQMGPGLIAWISLMNGRYHLTLRQIESLLQEQWGLEFSLGAISQSQEKLNNWLVPVYHQIGESVRNADPGYADETRHYRNRSVYWLWSLSTTQAAYFLIHYSRGKGAAKELPGAHHPKSRKNCPTTRAGRRRWSKTAENSPSGGAMRQTLATKPISKPALSTGARPTSRKSRKPATTDGVNPWQKQNRQHLPKTAQGLCQALDIYDTSGYPLN